MEKKYKDNFHLLLDASETFAKLTFKHSLKATFEFFIITQIEIFLLIVLFFLLK